MAVWRDGLPRGKERASHGEGLVEAVDHRLTFPRMLRGMSGLPLAPALTQRIRSVQ